MVPRQGPGSAPQIIRPVPHRPFFHLPDVPLRPLGKLERRKLHYTVFLWPIGNGNPLINGKSRNLSELVIAMSPHGANPVGTEGHILRLSAVLVFKYFPTVHLHSSQIVFHAEVISPEGPSASVWPPGHSDRLPDDEEGTIFHARAGGSAAAADGAECGQKETPPDQPPPSDS